MKPIFYIIIIVAAAIMYKKYFSAPKISGDKVQTQPKKAPEFTPKAKTNIKPKNQIIKEQANIN